MKEVFVRQREMMKEYGLDGMVTMAPENIGYMIGTLVPSQSAIRSRHAITIVTMDQDPVTICVNVEEELVKKNSWISPSRVYSYNEFLKDPMVLAAEKMAEMGLENKKVGIEYNYLPAKDYLTLTKVAPKILFVDAASLIEDMRKQKMKYELEFIEEFAVGAEDVIYSAFEGVKAGMTEMDIYRIVSKGFAAMGGETLNGCIASGERSSMLNAQATDRVLKEGDIVRLDLVGTKKGYWCDVCRTAVVGKPTDEQNRIWDIVVKSHDNIIKQIKPGVDTYDIYRNFAEEFRQAGYEASVDFVAHGLGLSVHEEPYINKFTHNILKENMAMCVEPIYIIPGVSAFHLENEVLVTGNGHRVISSKRPYDRLAEIRA